ncbi:hypothetical protein [Pedobacter antarcticus]|uniref:hypothetical protein n=1 Tax=Pedobacter antarcticus TaxID=34086 RepID=UPI002931DF8D|nr:hypothetical protein [Pedobacter antarcticus]
MPIEKCANTFNSPEVRMSNWNKKSYSNIEASELLINNDLSNQSIHCSYYSCVQYVFHIFCNQFGMDVVEVETQSLSQVNGVGTHKWLRRQIFKSIKPKNKEAAQWFYDAMGEMYHVRANADYNHINVESVEAKYIQEKAKNVVSFLKEFYEL